VRVAPGARDVARQRAALLGGNFAVGLDATCYDTDEPDNQLRISLSTDRSRVNASHAIDRELDSLFERQKRATSESDRAALIRQFERRAIEQGYVVPIVWWHRIVVRQSQIRGWTMSPSHYLFQDLASVWLARS